MSLERERRSFAACRRFQPGIPCQAVRRPPATISDRGWSAGLKQKMQRSRQCQFSGRLQGDRARVRGRRQCRHRSWRRSGGQLDQRADCTISADRSVRFVDRTKRARRGRTGFLRHRRRCRLGRIPTKGIEMDVPERQYDLDHQREQRQAGTQAYLRPEPVHHYAFTTAAQTSIAQLAGCLSRCNTTRMGPECQIVLQNSA